METEYLSCAETAKLIRGALKRAFPGYVFRVISRTYAGGASIDVSWTDGPTDKLVSAVVGCYSAGNIDGSIDMATTHTSWLLPDGRARLAHDPGTTGSLGFRAPVDDAMPVPGCRLVRFGANHVFTSRAHSPRFAERVLARVRERYGREADLELKVSSHDGSAYLSGDFHLERVGREIAARLVIVRAAA